MNSFAADIRLAWRVLWNNPGFTAVATAALALGIGANTIIFTAFNAILLRPLPYHDPERVVTIWDSFPQSGIARFGVAYANIMDIKERNHVFAPLGTYVAASNTSFNLTGGAGPERVQGTRASADFFATLGTAPLLGRALRVEDELPARNHVAVLGYRLWQRYHNGDPAIVGRMIRLNDEDYEVVGIMPPGFEFPSGAEMPPGQQFASATELWTPLTIPDNPGARGDRTTHYLRAIARLKPGVTLEEARGEMSVLAAQLARDHPNENQGLASAVTTLRENQVGQLRPALLVLVAAVAGVLLIACANLASLLLVRATARSREFTIRAALGASRTRIVRQLLTESTLLSLLGGVLGLALASGGIRVLVAVAPAGIPRLAEAQLDGRILGFTLLLSLATGLLFGLAPAMHAARADLNTGLKDAGRGASVDPRLNGLRQLLVIAEVTLVFVLLIGAGLMLKSFRRLLEVPPGFESQHVLSARVTLPAKSYPAARKLTFYHELVAQLGREPGVAAAAVIRDLPLSGTDPRYGFTVAARPAEAQNNAFTYRYRVASPDYFTVMGIPLKAGRFFSDHDNATAPGVAIINETAARQAWPGQDPIGQVITTGGPMPASCVVIGVVGDIRFGGFDSAPDLEVYYHYPQIPEGTMNAAIGSMAVVIRTEGDPAGVAAGLRQAVAALDKDVPVTSVKPMADLLAGSVAPRRFNLLLLGGFAAVSLVLAALGIYGVISYWVSQRTREIGVRLALGAETAAIFRLVIWQSMAVVLLGLGLGLALSLILARLLPATVAGSLFGVSATDPLTFLLVAAGLGLTGLLASVLPARRAIRVEPAEALRCD
ncbi:MAG TPA: ABC transporter permease [Lacunisphaera sp.]|nr:ABC transporter permease [Lacunisphaera sp.]